MADMENFDRQYRLAAGPAGGTGFEVGETSKSQPVPLHINFALQKSDLETQNTGRVTVWNLNPSQLAVLNQKDCCLSLRAGYKSRLSLIFAGIVSYVSTTKDGSDQKTEIEVIDNLIEIRDTYVSVSYNGTVSWKTIFDDVAGQMGVAVSYSYNATFSNLANGFSYPATMFLETGLLTPEDHAENLLAAPIIKAAGVGIHITATTESPPVEHELHITPVMGRGMEITALPELEPEMKAVGLYVAPVIGRGLSITKLPSIEPEFGIVAMVGHATAAVEGTIMKLMARSLEMILEDGGKRFVKYMMENEVSGGKFSGKETAK